MPPAEPAKQFNGTAKLDLTKPDDPIIWGDIADLTPIIQKYCKPEFRDGYLHVPPKDLLAIGQLCEVAGFRFINEPVPEKKSPPKKEEVKSQAATTKPPAAGSSAKSEKADTAEPFVVTGTIERLNMGSAGKSPLKMITLALPGGKKLMVGTFHKSHWDELEAGLGKLASFRVVTKGNYTNIEKLGLIKIGAFEYDEHGMKVIQRRDQEAGQRTLY